jgi:4-hydroxy-tetrahydrodipicolinate synthase
MAKMCEAAISGELTTARQIHLNLLKLHQLMFLEPNPVPVKWALHQMGKIDTGIRLPLLPMSESLRANLHNELLQLGLVNT